MAIPSGSFRQGLTQVSSTQYDDLGALRYEGGKFYKYLKLLNTTAGVAVAAGDVLGYGLAGIASNICVSDNSDAATKPVGAGVALATVAAADTLTGVFVWVQVTGAFTALKDIAGTTPADGDAVYLSTTDLTLTLAAAVDDPICAIIDDDSAQLCIAKFPF